MTDSTNTIHKRIARLEEAKRKYFESGEPIMEDYEYDAEEMIIAREAPGAEVLGAVGAPPEENVIKLPVPMPSLDKVKPNEPSWTKWLAKQSGEMQWSAKLDGISALWIPSEGRLYNRGDGIMGSDLTRFVSIIGGLKQVKGGPSMVRGEILIRKSEAPKEAKIIRSWVNGVLHRKEGEPLPPPGLLRFVAYRVLDPKSATAPMKDQFATLTTAGYEVPPHGYFKIGEKNRAEVEPYIIKLYEYERAEGPYEIDGIVLTSATAIQEKPKPTNPKDTVAFKMALAEQTAETTVKEVEWNLSRNGLLIPRIIIEPVTIGGATISKVTGHNAKFIVESGLGTGAKVLIRRSGDVIPIIDSILVPVEPQMPKGVLYTWDSVHIRPSEDSSGDAAKQLLHSLRVLGVKGAGESAAEGLVEGGYLTIFDIMNAQMSQIQTIIGTANGKKIKDNVDAAIRAADLATKILSYPDLPAGIGSSRIEAFVDAGANFDGQPPEGFGEQTWSALLGSRKGIEAWIAKFPAAATVAAIRRPAIAVIAKGSVATTGFRFDATTKAALEAQGWTIKDSLTKDCKYLIVPELPHESSKTQQAAKYGIPVIAKKTFMEMV